MYIRTIIYIYIHTTAWRGGREKKPLNLFSPTIIRQRYPFSVGRDLICVYCCLCLFYYNSATRLHRVKNADTFTFPCVSLLLRFFDARNNGFAAICTCVRAVDVHAYNTRVCIRVLDTRVNIVWRDWKSKEMHPVGKKIGPRRCLGGFRRKPLFRPCSETEIRAFFRRRVLLSFVTTTTTTTIFILIIITLFVGVIILARRRRRTGRPPHRRRSRGKRNAAAAAVASGRAETISARRVDTEEDKKTHV